MKIIFEITGEFDINGEDLSDNIDELKNAVESLRGFGSADAKYKIVVPKETWIKL